MCFEVLSTTVLAMLHDAIISQLLCIGASAADLLFWLSQVQELVLQVALLNLMPQFSQM
jgi:hypothetical protein